MDNFLFVFCLLFFSHGQLFSTRGPTIPGGHFCFACLPTTFSPFPATLPVTIIRRHLSNNPLSWWTFMLSSHLFQHFGEPFCSLMTLSPFSAIIFIYFALQQCFRSFSGTFSRNHSSGNLSSWSPHCSIRRRPICSFLPITSMRIHVHDLCHAKHHQPTPQIVA